jgi:hypothetical protein
MDTLFELLGYIGISMLLVAHFLLCAGHMKATDTSHLIMNLLGALFVVVAMQTGNTLPMFITLLLWLCISLFGLYKHHIACMDEAGG